MWTKPATIAHKQDVLAERKATATRARAPPKDWATLPTGSAHVHAQVMHHRVTSSQPNTCLAHALLALGPSMRTPHPKPTLSR